MNRHGSLWRVLVGAQAVAYAFVAWAFFLYPAWTTARAAFSSEVRATAQPPGLRTEFAATARRYQGWAHEYLRSQRAAHVSSHDVAATEWPMFGSVFFLMTAEELAKKYPDLLNDDAVRGAVDLAAQVVASPDTATWVKAKWGLDYLQRENVFYRMLLIMGLGSYESLTGDRRHADLLGPQAETLAAELLAAPHHLGDDYPGECYPNDVVWAVAAIERAARLGYVEQERVERLSAGVLRTLNGASTTKTGLPAWCFLDPLLGGSRLPVLARLADGSPTPSMTPPAHQHGGRLRRGFPGPALTARWGGRPMRARWRKLTWPGMDGWCS